MANVKITNLPNLTGASSASTDVLPVVDVSTDTTSKMTRAEFFQNVPSMGNVGIGVTLSAWGGNVKVLELTGGSLISFATNSLELWENSYWNGTSAVYKNTNFASAYSQTSGDHKWFNAPYGTAGNAITFTQAMMLDTSGNVGIGVTPSAWGGGWKGLQLGTGVSLWGGTNSATYLGNNEYYNGTNRVRIFSDSATEYAQLSGQHIWYNAPTGLGGSTITFTQAMTLDSVGALILSGSTAQKATGTTWSNPSDQRLKTNIMDYPKGITELMQVRVCEWEYNGKGGTTDGLKGLGVIADEIMTVLPNTVDTYDAKLNADDEDTTAIKKFDATEITWLLVKAVQEQQVMIENLQEEIAALKV